MIRVRNISKNFLKNKQYEILILDVNSLFLFGGKNSIKAMYAFIDSVKKSLNNKNLLVINVIDNGISQKVLRKYPYYKGNRQHSIQSNNIYVNKFGSSRSFKYKINRIHKIDGTYKNHLTFYLPGESDFKIGWMLKFLQERTPIVPQDVLTVSSDKDFMLCTALSDVLLKRSLANKRYWYLFDEDTNIEGFKSMFNLDRFKFRHPFEFFYFLLLNGDDMDNIKTLLNKNNCCKLINKVISQYGTINIELICKHLHEFSDKLNCNDVLENSYLVDLFNTDAFTTNQKNNMRYLFGDFLRLNGIRVFK